MTTDQDPPFRLSDRALEMLMRDVLEGPRDLAPGGSLAEDPPKERPVLPFRLEPRPTMPLEGDAPKPPGIVLEFIGHRK